MRLCFSAHIRMSSGDKASSLMQLTPVTNLSQHSSTELMMPLHLVCRPQSRVFWSYHKHRLHMPCSYAGVEPSIGSAHHKPFLYPLQHTERLPWSTILTRLEQLWLMRTRRGRLRHTSRRSRMPMRPYQTLPRGGSMTQQMTSMTLYPAPHTPQSSSRCVYSSLCRALLGQVLCYVARAHSSVAHWSQAVAGMQHL